MSEYNWFPRCTNSRQRAGRPRQTANSNALSGIGPQGYPQAVGTSDLALGWGAHALPMCHATAPGPSAGIARCGAPLRRPAGRGGPRVGETSAAHPRPSSRRCRCPETASPRHMARCGGSRFADADRDGAGRHRPGSQPCLSPITGQVRHRGSIAGGDASPLVRLWQSADSAANAHSTISSAKERSPAPSQSSARPIISRGEITLETVSFMERHRPSLVSLSERASPAAEWCN